MARRFLQIKIMDMSGHGPDLRYLFVVLVHFKNGG
jgi:hypothetical protein